MKPVPLPPIEYLKSRLSYDKWNGKLTWLERPLPPNDEYSQREIRRWNSRFAGKKAGLMHKRTGYWVISIDGKQYKYHRICYAIGIGNCEFGMVDHISGNSCDNRFRNLRETDATGNARNSKVCSKNKTGFKGVQERDGKFIAYISTNSGRVHLGTFRTKKEAVLKRRAAEAENGYHKNHGRDICE